jgi:hypothetical protein
LFVFFPLIVTPARAEDQIKVFPYETIQQIVNFINTDQGINMKVMDAHGLCMYIRYTYNKHYSPSDIDEISALLNDDDADVVSWVAMSLALIGA